MQKKIKYKELYILKCKELLALKISINPYWKGEKNEFCLIEKYNLKELEDIWFRLVEDEHEDWFISNTDM